MFHFGVEVFSCPLSDISLTRRRRGLAEGDWVSLLLRLVLAGLLFCLGFVDCAR